MPRVLPIKRRDLIDYLRQLSFDGPFPGHRHSFMTRGNRRAIIPNPHQGDIDTDLLARILRQAGVSRDEGEAL